MSLDARYILSYDCLPYVTPTPMQKDKMYLLEKYGGEFIEIGWEYDIFWNKPKYTLLPEDLKVLLADQVLEKRDCEYWKIIN